MDQELDDLLCKKFPNLYRDRDASMRETCMCWGFDVGNGWFQLIYDLSEKLETLILQIPEEDRKYCCASQVKEKYATLRFYMTTYTDEIDKLIEEAEHKSAKICEVCGAPGKIRVTGYNWLYTSCEEHKRK